MNHNGVAYFSDAECHVAINVYVVAFPSDVARFGYQLYCFGLLSVHVAAPVVVDRRIISQMTTESQRKALGITLSKKNA
jgi:hypothetical protein